MALTILAEQQDGLLTLTFNRPEKRNALNTETYLALTDALRQAARDEEVHVLLLQGQAECFTAGNDLADFVGKHALEPDDPILQFLHTLADFPKPVIAAVGGPAVGIGTTLLLHCDLVYLGDNARLQLPFVELGLVPEFAASLLLPRAVGHLKVAELLLLAMRLCASSPCRAWAKARASRSMTKCTACLSSCLSSALLFWSAIGGLAASFSPCSRAKGSRSAGASTRLASPRRSASSPSMASASSNSSAALR